MALKHVLYFTIFVGLCAVVLQVKDVREHIRLFTDRHIPGVKSYVISSSAFDLWTKLISKIGLTSTESSDKSLPGQNAIRQQRDPLYTKDELSKYDGTEGSLGLYLAILGRVYDVEKGATYYAPGKGYSFFSGRDGTKAFMTGEFTEKGLIDEVIGLNLQQMLELENWIDFYDKTYIYKGKLIGNFYDENGKPTKALLEAQEQIKEAHKDKESKEEHKRKFPPCNSSWTKAQGGWVSCSDKSGGVSRDWVGVPRKYHTPGEPKPKCVCIRTTGPPYDDPSSTKNRGELDNPHIEEYENCAPTAETCQVS